MGLRLFVPRIGICLACCTFVSALTLKVQAGPSRGGFSSREEARLRSGALVTRPAHQQRGELDLRGGSAWQVIDRPMDAVWAGLMDTSHYHRWLPQVAKARVVSRRSGSGGVGERVIRVEHSTGPFDVYYYLETQVDTEKRQVTFKLSRSRGGSLREAWGYFALKPYGQRTLFSFGAMVDIGDGLVVGLVRRTAQQWMLKIPWLMKRFMEGSGRWIYKSASP